MTKPTLLAPILAAISAVALPVAAAAQDPPAAQTPPARAAPTAADQRLKAIYDAYADWNAREYGYYEDSKGENQPADYLPRVDPATQLRRAEHLGLVLAQVKAV